MRRLPWPLFPSWFPRSCSYSSAALWWGFALFAGLVGAGFLPFYEALPELARTGGVFAEHWRFNTGFYRILDWAFGEASIVAYLLLLAVLGITLRSRARDVRGFLEGSTLVARYGHSAGSCGSRLVCDLARSLGLPHPKPHLDRVQCRRLLVFSGHAGWRGATLGSCCRALDLDVDCSMGFIDT